MMPSRECENRDHHNDRREEDPEDLSAGHGYCMVPGRCDNLMTMGRAIAGVILGIVVWIVVATVGNWLIRAALPGYTAVEVSMAFTVPMLLARLALGVVSSLCAGAVCALIVKRSKRAPIVVGVLLLVMFLPVHYMLWDKFPIWYHLFFLLSLAPAVWLGARLAARKNLAAPPAVQA